MNVDRVGCLRRTALSLPEELVLEILVRVEDPAALFRCAVASRAWNRLVADDSFLRRRWPDMDSSVEGTRTSSTFVAGFFARKFVPPCSIETLFVPTPRSVFSPGSRPLGSFSPKAAHLLKGDMEPLITRRGLLLIRLSSGTHPLRDLRLAVCNMLTGVCQVLPPLNSNWRSDISYAILTGPDCSANGKRQAAPLTDYLAFFKVLILAEDGESIYQPLSLYTFLSQEGRWSAPIKCTFDAMNKEGDYMMPHFADAVVCNGMTYWEVLCKSKDKPCFDTCIIEIDTDPETRCVSLTRVEIPAEYLYVPSYKKPRLKVTNGRTLSVFCPQLQGTQVAVFTRNNDKKGENNSVAKWLQTSVVELEPHRNTPVETKRMCLQILDEKAGKLLVDAGKGNMYTADLKTGTMEAATDWSYGVRIRRKVVLLEMDWPAFFASRLGRPYIKTDSRNPHIVTQREKGLRKERTRYP